MKIVKRFIRNILSSGTKKAFYIMVKCRDCGEAVKIRINRASDFQAEYNARNPGHCYTVRKEIVGKNCFNLMKAKIALTRNIKVLFVDTDACEFIEFKRE